MASNNNDLYFTLDGDFIIGSNGDLLDTDGALRIDSLATIKQNIAHRLLAEKNGWSLHPGLCAGLEKYIGQTNSPDLLKDMENQIRYILTFDGLFTIPNLTVRVLDLGLGTEAIIITIFLRGISETPVFTLAFDMQGGQITQVR